MSEIISCLWNKRRLDFTSDTLRKVLSLQASNNDHESGLKQESFEPGDAPRLGFGHTPADYMLLRNFSGSIKMALLRCRFLYKKLLMSETTMQDHMGGNNVLCSLIVQSWPHWYKVT
jgi:hypothetical protein